MLRLLKSMETGITEIDDQHRELVDRINKVVRMGEAGKSKEETDETLNFLAEYALKHFSTEDDYMNKCSYPICYIHQGQHSGFVEKFLDIKARYEKSGYSAEISTELNAFLVSWTVNHIATSDAAFGRYYLKKIGANPDAISV